MNWNFSKTSQQLHRWSLGMDKWLHPTLYNGFNYLSMLGLKVHPVSKRDHLWKTKTGFSCIVDTMLIDALSACFARDTHYSHVTMSAMASQITSVTTAYFTVCSDADQRKHQSSASLAFVTGIHRWPVNSPHKGPVRRKRFPFHGVIMSSHSIGQDYVKYYILSTRWMITDPVAIIKTYWFMI